VQAHARAGLILCAEDDEDDRLFIGEAIARLPEPPEVRFVGDGRELLDYLRHAGRFADPASAPRPDLVLLDLNMPRMTGREALPLLKGDPELRALPVVVLTTSDDPRDVRGCYDAGANAFVTKPSSMSELARVLATTVAFWLGVARPAG
jgi:CheY-like chemotaxis protein